MLAITKLLSCFYDVVVLLQQIQECLGDQMKIIADFLAAVETIVLVIASLFEMKRAERSLRNIVSVFVSR